MIDEAWDEDGAPWASPEIRQEYEAALGRFILEFRDYVVADSTVQKIWDKTTIVIGLMKRFLSMRSIVVRFNPLTD